MPALSATPITIEPVSVAPPTPKRFGILLVQCSAESFFAAIESCMAFVEESPDAHAQKIIEQINN